MRASGVTNAASNAFLAAEFPVGRVSPEARFNYTSTNLPPGLQARLSRELCAFEAMLLPEIEAFKASNVTRNEFQAPVTLAMKEPKVMFMLPLLRERIPHLKFLHLVRDGARSPGLPSPG